MVSDTSSRFYASHPIKDLQRKAPIIHANSLPQGEDATDRSMAPKPGANFQKETRTWTLFSDSTKLERKKIGYTLAARH
jgi:hypothetical protein